MNHHLEIMGIFLSNFRKICQQGLYSRPLFVVFILDLQVKGLSCRSQKLLYFSLCFDVDQGLDLDLGKRLIICRCM